MNQENIENINNISQEDINQITKDFHRFAKLHSWYKHLPIDGKIFVFYRQQGQQVRYDFDKKFTESDQTKEYWHFLPLDSNKKYIKELFDSNKQLYWTKFGSFLRGIEDGETEHVRCFHWNKEKKNNYLKNKYPDIIIENDYDIESLSVITIVKAEYQEYLNGVLEFKKFVPDIYKSINN